MVNLKTLDNKQESNECKENACLSIWGKENTSYKANNDSSAYYSHTQCRTNTTEIPFQGASSLRKEASSLPGGEGIISSSYQRSLHYLVT